MASGACPALNGVGFRLETGTDDTGCVARTLGGGVEGISPDTAAGAAGGGAAAAGAGGGAAAGAGAGAAAGSGAGGAGVATGSAAGCVEGAAEEYEHYNLIHTSET